MSGPSLRLALPPGSLFKFPPDEAPPAQAPAADALHTILNPFPINAETYNALLHPAVPLTIATVYATTVTYLNAYNRKQGNKPWAISKTRAFYAFVILHNVFLAVYSAVTCWAMARGLISSLSGSSFSFGLVGSVDALCKIHGPRGLGNAVAYSPESESWGVKNKLIQLSHLGGPDPTDLGRLWNEGLSFWGWWFYLSKFYEVLDTAIILAKGKRSTTLQTYHHAGAMLCMWAGIRYMSPPIWLFVQMNSAIHAMMYTYYTISALGFRVPQAIKRSLTTMQIMQFLIGASFAAIHLFVYYTVPVSTPYLVARAAASAVTAAPSVVSSAIADATSASAAVKLGDYIKRLALRAAGEEGLAENIGAKPGHLFKDQVIEAVQNITHNPQDAYDTLFRDEYEWVQCLDTTGASFAVWLNVLYLAPLTALFVRFFVRSYIKRTSAGGKQSAKPKAITAAKSAEDAAKGVEKKADEAVKVTDSSKAAFENKNINDRVAKILAEESQTVLGQQEASDVSSNEISGSKKETEQEVKKEEQDPQANGIPSPPLTQDDEDEIREEKGEEANDSQANGSAGGGLLGGLSTTDPNEAGVEYAEVVKTGLGKEEDN